MRNILSGALGRFFPRFQNRKCGWSSKGNTLRQMCVVSLFLGLIPLTAMAQGSRTQDHDKWEAAFFGGGSFLGDKNCSTPVQGSSQGS